MSRKRMMALVLSFTLALSSTIPAFAGTWIALEDNTWEYLDDDGENVTGWIEDGDDTYFLDMDGIKKIGWFKSKGAWYHFDEDGKMERDTWVDNYYLNEDGKFFKKK